MGRHTATGGGNHVVLGGATPADGPLLRRPELLRSMLTFWQNHPLLSYLFAGAFIGPTSQYPRVDEARHGFLVRARDAFEQAPKGLETWNVRGEEATSGGNSRSVESSLDRVEVKVSGLTDRHAIACNGRRVPVYPTGKPAESVGGVRYRA